MPISLSIYYINPLNNQYIKPDNLIIPLPDQRFLVHENDYICLYDTKDNTSIEKHATYKKVTFNPIDNTLFCVNEDPENDQIKTLDELSLKDLSPVKTNIPVPFLTPAWLDEERWLGFNGSSVFIVYNHKTQSEEKQTPNPVLNIKNLTTYQKNLISVDSGYQTTVLSWENQTLTEVLDAKKDVMQVTPEMINDQCTIKKTLSMSDNQTLAILTAAVDKSCSIYLMNSNSRAILSTISFDHEIEDINVLSNDHLIAIIDHSFSNKQVSERVNQEIILSLPSALKDPSSIINEYVGNQILYPYSLFQPQCTITHAAETALQASPKSKKVL